jgi:hypothetical protein
MIAQITKAYTRLYRDNGQHTAYVEWVDRNGREGRTEAPVLQATGTLAEVYGLHMGALMARAICSGHAPTHEKW